MLKRVQTLEKYETEEKALANIVKKLSTDRDKTSVEVKTITGKVENLKREEQETTVRLNERQQEEQLFEDSVQTTKTLMKRYSLRDQDFKNLLHLIRVAGTRETPSQTMEKARLLPEQYRTRGKLEAMINGRNETLLRLNTEISNAEERLKTSTEAFTEQSRKIEQLAKEIRAAIKKSYDEAAAALKKSGAQESSN